MPLHLEVSQKLSDLAGAGFSLLELFLTETTKQNGAAFLLWSPQLSNVSQWLDSRDARGGPFWPAAGQG